jgi:response regulator RpfG family c-di-GMP phosphodiesterase
MPVPTFALIGPCLRGNMVEQEKCNAGHDAKKTVLVVEDEVLIRLDLSEEIRAAGFTVIEAASADERSRCLRVGTTSISY